MINNLSIQQIRVVKFLFAILKKIPLRMKLMVFMLFLSVGLLRATGTYGQITSLTLEARNETVQQVLDKIEAQSEFSFFYNNKQVNVDRLVSINTKNQNVFSILNKLFDGTDVTYKVLDKSIILSIKENEGNSFPKTDKKVSGIVLDEKGEPVIGANVMVKGTTNGTVTDMDGKFSLQIPEGTELEVSYIGFLTQMVKVTGDKVSVVIKEDTQKLDEVVVVGYGTMKKSDLTGSISVTKSDDLLKSQPFSALDGLKGKASGVNVFSNSGQPGGGMRVVIRGVGSINSSSDPLYVVDGVVMENFKYLNPNDIESMEVLKDASSAAIYGSRGANGVILVTTKRGRKDKGAVISYDGSLSVGTMSRYMDLLNSEEWMQAFETSMENANKWYGANVSTNRADYFKDPRLFDSNGNPLYDTDWQREATRTTWSHNHQLSIQYGGNKTSTGAFLNYTDQQGLLLNNYMKRLNAKITFDAEPTTWLSTSVNLLVNHSWGNTTKEDGGNKQPRRTMIEMMPWMPMQFEDGTWSSSTTISDNIRIENISNPVYALNSTKQMRYRTQVFGNASLTFHLLPGLDLKTQIGIDSHNSRHRDFFPPDLRGAEGFPLGTVNLVNSESLYWQEETFLTYQNTINKHRLNLMGGLSWQERTYRTNKSTSQGFSNNFYGFENIGVGTIPGIPSSNYDAWSMNSYFLRAGYTYDDRYTVTATTRVDGSSRFGGNNKYGFFPSIGVGWIISNESFMKNVEFIGLLKLHSSFGVTGNTDIGSYSSLALVDSYNTLINGVLTPASQINRLANPDLQWEKTNQFDVGINLNLFNNRLNFDVSYYNKYTYDLLLDKPLPYSTGFKSVIDNIGSVRNTGLDVMINTVNVQTSDFRWTTSLNMNYNKNKICSLGDNDADIFPGPMFVNTSSTILRVGESLGSFWGYKRLGIWTEDEAAEAQKVGQHVGEVKRSNEMEIIGKGLPDLTGSIINTFTYKNFDLTVDLQFVTGVDVFQHFKHSTEDRFGLANGLSSILHDAWSPSNTNTLVPAIRYAPTFGQNSHADSGWVCDGSYLRGNLIQLGYVFDSSLTKKMRVGSFRVFAGVSNFFLLTSKDFAGYDPEATSYDGNKWGQNISFFEYPKPRTYTVGFNVSF